jgi:hypothetical protein
MIIYAVIYWSIILILGIFFTIKAFKVIYEYILILGRKWLLTRILIILPIRLAVNTISSIFTGIIIFFHVLFFVCIIVFIYVFTIGSGDSKFFTDSMAYICLFSLFSPIVYTFFKTLYEEYSDFKQTRLI